MLDMAYNFHLLAAPSGAEQAAKKEPDNSFLATCQAPHSVC